MNEHIRYGLQQSENPAFFFENMLGCSMWDKQLEIAESVKKNKRTAVRSANTVGKSFAAARIMLWYLYTHYPSIVITVSPTFRQLKNVLWREIHTAYNSSKVPLGGEIMQTQLNVDTDWFALGVAYKDGAETAETIQGYHAENILFIVDEASGVPPQVYQAIDGSMNTGGARLLSIGNPMRISGDFADSFKSPIYHQIHISAFDSPNLIEEKTVIPSLVTKEGVEEMRQKYGEDSDIYRVRVLGEFPKAEDQTVIPLSFVEAAQQEERKQEGSDEFLGVDVARFGSDRTAFIYRKGNYAEVLKVIHKSDLMTVAGECVDLLRAYPKARMFIDSIGVGAGVFDRLRENEQFADRVFGVNVAEKATDTEHYINRRAELWFVAREWLETAVLKPSPEWLQLSAPRYKFTSSGKYQLESKEDIKKRTAGSPDIADALTISFAENNNAYHKFIR